MRQSAREARTPARNDRIRNSTVAMFSYSQGSPHAAES